MKSQMTAFALPAKCGLRGASGSSVCEAGFSSARSRSASASRPNPPPARARNSRRDRYAVLSEGDANKRGMLSMRNRLRGINHRGTENTEEDQHRERRPSSVQFSSRLLSFSVPSAPLWLIFLSSLHVQEFIEAEQHLAQIGHR